MARNVPAHWQPTHVAAAANSRTDSQPPSPISRTNTGFSEVKLSDNRTTTGFSELKTPDSRTTTGFSELKSPYSRATTGFSELKRAGTSSTWWESWRLFKPRTGSETSPSSLPGCNHGFKPYTMRKRVLVSIAIWTAVLTAIIEILAQKSARTGGLSLARTDDEIPAIEEFMYEFLPTIIAVLLSIAWTWVDLDVKRMQPWLEMSKEGGAKVEDSLTLEYPHDFVAFVPLTAGKRRHWTVVVSGAVMVLIFWVITPLQGAIFGKGPVNLQEPATFYTPQDLMPIQDQSRATDTTILQHLHAITFLDQSYPPFTTAQYAFRPFKLETDSNPGPKSWTATTTKLWTDLKCHPAQMTATESEKEFDFENDKGCNVSAIESGIRFKESQYRMLYLGWHNSTTANQFLERPTCDRQSANNFLAAATRKVDGGGFETTALFCETSYWKQRVSVAVPDDSFRPDDASIAPAGPVEELPAAEFNSTGFEYLLGSSVSEVQGDLRDHRRNIELNQFSRFEDVPVDTPVDTMAAFVVARKDRPLDDYLDESLLEEAYRALHKSAFVLAYYSLLSEESASKEKSEGSVEFVMHGVIVSRAFSAVVEALLLTISVCCILLLVLSARMKSNLSTDPAALRDQMRILRNSPDLLSVASHAGSLERSSPLEPNHPRSLEQRSLLQSETARLHLRCGCQSVDGAMSIAVSGIQKSSPPSPGGGSDDSSSPSAQGEQEKQYSPLILKRRSGFVFAVLLVAALAGLVALRHQEQRLGGLPRPTDRFEILQLLENYIPTAIATLIEPYWILVNRMLCIFQPYDDLHKTNKGSCAKRAIGAKYASKPPQIALATAAKLGHILLLVICVVALLANVLAVGLGGLFTEKTVRKSYAVDLHFIRSHKIDLPDNGLSIVGRGPKDDHWYAVIANKTLDNRIPPWVTPEYYFQPFAAADPSPQNSTETFDGRTRGYGLEINCDETQAYAADWKGDLVDLQTMGERYPDHPGSQCREAIATSSGEPGIGGAPMSWEGVKYECGVLVVSWGRSAWDPQTDRDVRHYICRPTFQTALFDVSVDSQGHVLSHTQVSEFSDNLGYEQSRNDTNSVLDLSMTTMAYGNSFWHNDTLSRTWYSEVVKIFNGTRLLDPSEPLPEPSYVLSVTKEIWRRSFAYMLASPEQVRFAPAGADQAPFSGSRHTSETRIFISGAAFGVSAAILALYIVTAAVLYFVSARPFLPRPPTCLGAALQFTAASRAVREYEPGIDAELRFGRYIGVDRRKHTGIEYGELVVPVGAAALRTGEKSSGAALRRRFWKSRERPVQEEHRVSTGGDGERGGRPHFL